MADREKILSGPSREELFDALRLINERRSVTFTWGNNLVGSRIVNVHILSLIAEDGSGDKWLGTARMDSIQVQGNFDFFYDSKSRKGWIDRIW